MLLVLVRELEEDERRTEEHGNDAGQVGPLVTGQERLFRGLQDLRAVLRVLRRDVGGSAKDMVSWFCTLVVRSGFGGAPASAPQRRPHIRRSVARRRSTA